VGHPGTGKTFAACSILKRAVLPSTGEKNSFSAFYTTMADAVSKILSSSGYEFRSLVKYYDFMVIDELDPRFFPSQNSMELYGNHLENILRTRVQNKLPTIMCTNSEDVNQIFSGEFGRTFQSLVSQYVRVIRAGGKDVRKGKEKL
jgi:DNA replication protein DnaC